ncbi:MAG TPA: SPW repeat protein [Longimicrobium sp.]|nr:SPW repeat protein [Longimicrobium sp.]
MIRLSTRVHGMLDYAAGALLVALPFVGGFGGGPQTWVPVGLGVALLLYSALTDYELGLVKRLPVPAHLWLDAVGGVLLAVSPWLFGFDSEVWLPHLLVGLFEVVSAIFTDTIPAYERRRAG